MDFEYINIMSHKLKGYQFNTFICIVYYVRNIKYNVCNIYKYLTCSISSQRCYSLQIVLSQLMQ